MGRLWLRSELVRREVTQARLEDELRRRPGLLDTPLPRPLVVVGLPRTGTTLLHSLLGCDPQALVLPFWQLRRPYPIPRRRLDQATRILRAATMARLGPVGGTTAGGHPSGRPSFGHGRLHRRASNR